MLDFIPYGRKLLRGAGITTIEIGRLGGLVAHVGIILDNILNHELNLGTSSQMCVCEYLQALRNETKINALCKPITKSFSMLWGRFL